jgi:hypothetical protein
VTTADGYGWEVQASAARTSKQPNFSEEVRREKGHGTVYGVAAHSHKVRLVTKVWLASAQLVGSSLLMTHIAWHMSGFNSPAPLTLGQYRATNAARAWTLKPIAIYRSLPLMAPSMTRLYYARPLDGVETTGWTAAGERLYYRQVYPPSLPLLSTSG